MVGVMLDKPAQRKTQRFRVRSVILTEANHIAKHQTSIGPRSPEIRWSEKLAAVTEKRDPDDRRTLPTESHRKTHEQ